MVICRFYDDAWPNPPLKLNVDRCQCLGAGLLCGQIVDNVQIVILWLLEKACRYRLQSWCAPFPDHSLESSQPQPPCHCPLNGRCLADSQSARMCWCVSRRVRWSREHYYYIAGGRVPQLATGNWQRAQLVSLIKMFNCEMSSGQLSRLIRRHSDCLASLAVSGTDQLANRLSN